MSKRIPRKGRLILVLLYKGKAYKVSDSYAKDFGSSKTIFQSVNASVSTMAKKMGIEGSFTAFEKCEAEYIVAFTATIIPAELKKHWTIVHTDDKPTSVMHAAVIRIVRSLTLPSQTRRSGLG